MNTIRVQLKSSSPMPVKVAQCGNTIDVESDSSYDYKILHGEIVAETNRAKEVEEYLQKQIDDLEHSIKYIEIFEDTGRFDQEIYNLLIDNNLNQIIYVKGARRIHYRFSLKTSNTRRYVSLEPDDTGARQYIDVNMTTRRWEYKATLNPTLESHINDKGIHIQPGERQFWNDKVTANFTGSIEQGELILTDK